MNTFHQEPRFDCKNFARFGLRKIHRNEKTYFYRNAWCNFCTTQKSLERYYRITQNHKS